MTRARLVALVGPTASGKSELGLMLAERVGGEIVAADACQVYRGLDIGTAKATACERRRVPHHCLDLVEPGEAFDVAQWATSARRVVAGLAARGRPVVVVGGTGLYVRVLLRGLCSTPAPSADLRAALSRLAARHGEGELRRWLGRLDPVAARRIHANDRVRIARALEVVLQSGRALSETQAGHGFAAEPYDAHVVVLDLPPDDLAARIAARTDAMLAAGWCDEVARLMRSLPAAAPAWQTLGYRELRAHLRGECDLATARDAIVVATRRFAKRQRTWWRREARERPLVWWDPRSEREGRLDAMASFLVANHPVAG